MADKALNVYLIGARGHSKVIADILNVQKRLIGGVFDRDAHIKQMLEFFVENQPEEGQWPSPALFIIGIGNNFIRKRIAEENHDVMIFTTAVHPRSTISSYVTIGEGTVVMAGAVVNVDSYIGKHVILNTNCSIDHDCILGDYVHVSPNAALAGSVEVGEGTHIGIGTNVIQGIKIGRWVTIGAGSVVIRDVPDYAVVVGNPGRIIKYNKKDILK
ncbi:acetyltransferase [Pedobacter frigoris]|uniref:acetyltransferase n=1 Tax=Pedobacter frigoris TaxID=2571272 RepID=UPI002930C75D|nr:acetyltransferase [Pedobacter frigoris]